MIRLLAFAVLCGICFGQAAWAAAAASKLAQRSDIAAKDKWRLEDIYATNDLWEQDFKKFEAMIPRMAAMKGHLGRSADSLLAVLKLDDEIGDVSGKLTVYAGMRRDEDNRVNTYLGMVDRMTGLGTRLGEAQAFMDPEILEIPSDKLESFYKVRPELSLYRHSLENIQRTRAHTLNESEEKLLALTGDFSGSAQSIFTAFNNADLRYGTLKDDKGAEIELTKGRYSRALDSPDRRYRRDAFLQFNRAYKSYNNTLGATMNANVKKDVFYARARKHGSALEAALNRNNIPVSVYRNLVSTVNANLEPLHRYAALRKKWLHLDTLHVYDLYTPLLPNAKIEVPFEQAKVDVVKGLEPLGEEYLSVFRKGLESGWIDVYETEGKTSGAYNWGSYSTHPYVLMNYSNSLEDQFTLAHEMGHALHSYFTRHYQPIVYGNYATFVAEVASTTNEATLINYLLKKDMKREERLYLLNFLLEQMRTTFFRQTLFAEFEMRTHEMAEKGDPLTAEAMNKVYHDLYQKYYGPDLVLDPEADVEWSRVPHFYTAFYVYQYATSYAAATALSKKILSEGDPAVQKYLTFLKSGSSDYPIEVLKRAGVDMTTPAPVEATIARFSEVLSEMEKLWDAK